MSAAIRLEADKLYYVEVLVKQGTGGDYLAVACQFPDGTLEAPMLASHFIPITVPITPPILSLQPTNIFAPEAGTAVFRVAVSNLDLVTYQWQRNGVSLGGATNASYTNLQVTLQDQGALYDCLVSNILGAIQSQTARLTVAADALPPRIVSVVNTDTRAVLVIYSEPVFFGNQITNYALNNGVGILSISNVANSQTFLLTTTPLLWRTSYTLTVNNVTDRSEARNRIPLNTQFTFTTMEFTPVDIGKPARTGSILPIDNGFRLTAGGTDIGGTDDQFQFAYQERSGNFDTRVRVSSLELSDPWAQVGLMARASLQTDSAFAAVLATPSISGCFFESRFTKGVPSTRLGSFPVNYPNTWLRLKRAGDTFTGYASLDGQQWTPLGSVNIVLTNKFYFGIALTSHRTNLTAAAEVRDMGSVTGTPATGSWAVDYEPLGPSSRRTPLVVSEIMYHPAPRADGKDLEFIELFNTDPVAVDLTGCRLSGAVEYVFPAGTQIPGGGFLVVAKSPADVQAVYGLKSVLGSYNGRLQNQTGSVRLLHRLGAILLEALFSDQAPWPVAADGVGHSLVLARPSLGEANPAAWAASEWVGGSPGRAESYRRDGLKAVVINEFLAHIDDPEKDYIELYNHSDEAVNIGGCFLSDSRGTNKFMIPANTVIPGKGYFAFAEDRLGFALNSEGETIYFWNAEQTRVIDAVRYGPQANGVATGRFPDGAPVFSELSSRTPGMPNLGLLIRDVVINEIMFNPVSGDSNDEYVELYNKGTHSIDVSGWQFVDGIDYTIPIHTVIPKGGYLVVARSAARLLANYTNLNSSNLVGDYPGTLANQGERLALAMPEVILVTNAHLTVATNYGYIVVDEVAYQNGGRWGQWTDGGGSSLELGDAHSDNRLAPNWADSIETNKSVWTTLEKTGVLDWGKNVYGIATIEILMLGAGECLVDNVEVLDANSVNLVVNSTFEGGAFGWAMRGDHKRSSLQTGGGFNSSRCLYVRASSRGDTGPNQIIGNLSRSLAPGEVVTIRAKVRWLRGWPEILFRLHGNYLEATGRMALPSNLGSPGARNSRAVSNLGPAIYDVTPRPVLPAAGEPITVTARVYDPDRVASVVLKYRYDPASTVNTITMVDDGTGPDLCPGDGIYTAVIPGQPQDTMIAYSIQATDLSPGRASATFPNDAPARECLVRFGEFQPTGNYHAYRIWVTQATFNEWSSREKGSNEPLDATFVYGNYRAIYNMGAMYSGSPYHWTGYNTPTGNLCYYSAFFSEDDRLLGATDFVLNAPGNVGGEPTGLRERMFHEMAAELGLPQTHRRFVHMFFNGVRRSFIYEDAQAPNGDYLDEWFPNDPNGDLYKIEDWFEYNSAVTGFVNEDAVLNDFTTTGGVKKLAAYRHMWRKRAVPSSANDYTNLFDLVDVLNYPDTNRYTAAVESLVDVNNWMRTLALRHAAGDWDSYGYTRGKNMYTYKPTQGLFQLLNWDISFGFGMGDGPTTDIFYNAHLGTGVVDDQVERMFDNPPFRRLYLQAVQEMVSKTFQPSWLNAYLDPRYAALLANGVAADNPAPVKSWIASRKSYLEKVLASNAAPFIVTAPATNRFSTNRNLITLAGTAPLTVDTLRINGLDQEIQWTSVTNWVIHLALPSGSNNLQVVGYDRRGFPVAGAQATLEVTYSGAVELPQDHLVINEIMYHPSVPDADFVELFNTSFSQAFDLSGGYFDGIDFTFPSGTFLPAQGYLVVVKNRVAFEAYYGSDIPMAGEFAGKLNNAGETLRLVKLGTTTLENVIIDEVNYGGAPPWPQAANGLGSSLQLIDPLQDNDRIGNWTAVGTNGLAEPHWQYAALTGPVTGSRLEISLNGTGQVYCDELTLVAGVLPETGVNLLNNGGFEQDLTGSWTVSVNSPNTAGSALYRHAGSQSLQIAAATNQVDAVTVVSQDITPGLANGQLYTLSFWYLTTAQGGDFVVRLTGDGILSSISTRMETMAQSTPGRVNSVRAAQPSQPRVWINEVQPQNVTSIADAAGHREPWIELFNADASPRSLAGFYLTDQATNLMAWAFPANAVVQPGQFLVVWADGQPGESTANEFHTAFRLSPASGFVALSRMQDTRPIVVDYLRYASVAEGLSFGSYPDGNAKDRHVFLFPTPGAANNSAAVPVLVRINEWMASNTRTLADPADGRFDDWFELYNAGGNPVDLSGYTLTDDLANPRQFTIPAGTTIAPNGFLLVWADNEVAQNGLNSPLHVNFKLSQNGEAIGLFAPDGTIIDTIAFGPQKPDVSQGRFPDGTPMPFFFLPQATPKAPNANPNVDQPKLLSIAASASGTTLVFQTTPSKRYQVQYLDSLLPGPWLNLNGPVTATSAATTVTDFSMSVSGQRYYRVKLVLAP